MCPDRELLSAYADGEVPSPWNERIADHLASCEACSAVVEEFSCLGGRLRAESCPGESAIVDRGRARLDRELESAARSASWNRPRRPGSAWGRSISLPLPLAAAAALALLLFAGLSAASLFRSAPGSSPALASAEVAPNGAHQVSMDGILRYLDSQNAQVTVTIKLPSETTFNEPGNPVIVRAPKVYQGASTVSAPAAPDKGGNP
jgi:anti-sigma factor RsiW